jgi:hypothetical protein
MNMQQQEFQDFALPYMPEYSRTHQRKSLPADSIAEVLLLISATPEAWWAP